MNHNPPWNTGLRTHVLSKTELRVAGFVSQGLTDDEIAFRMKSSAATAKTHIKRARLKLGLRNRVQLAVWFVTRQLPAAEPLSAAQRRSAPLSAAQRSTTVKESA